METRSRKGNDINLENSNPSKNTLAKTVPEFMWLSKREIHSICSFEFDREFEEIPR